MFRTHLLVGVLAFGLGGSLAGAGEIVNSDFEDGLNGWTVKGSVTVDQTLDNGFAYFQENPEGATSSIYQVFNLPNMPESLTFTYLIGWHGSGDAPGRFPSDSFSVFVLDANTQERLVPPPGEPPPAFDDFFFANNEEVVEFEADYVTVEGPDEFEVRTVTVDLTSLPSGREVHVEFGLAGGPDGFDTFALVDGVVVTSLNLPPTCDVGGSYAEECRGTVTEVPLGATGTSDPDDDPLELVWSSTCPGAVFDDPTSVLTTMSVYTSPGCSIDCLATLTVSDGINEPVSCDAEVSVSDTTNPVLADVPDDVMVECDAVSDPADPTASDNCDPSPTIDFTETQTEGDCPSNYTLTRTWTATDECGHSSSESQVITVQDTTAPDITCPDETAVECDGAGNTVELDAWLSSADGGDACGDASLENDFTGLSDDCGATGSATVTWTATDECDLQSSCPASFTIVDTTPPGITCPANVTLECPADASPEATGSATGSDVCSASAEISFADVSVRGPGGTETITRTWTATDECGNSLSCDQMIEVVDTASPVVNCTVATDVLWSPNHHLVEVGLEVTVFDSCDQVAAEESLIIEVWSDETEVPDTGDGTGNHCPDAKDIYTSLRLRNERRGRENGRVYLIIARAEDGSGNVGFSYCAVMVPHDQSDEGLEEVAAQVEAALETVANTPGSTIAQKVAPLGYYQHGISGERGPHQ